LGFKKLVLSGGEAERIKRGEKRRRENVFSGDFDVFASCPSGNPHINSLVAVKKQQKRKPPAHPKNCFVVPASTFGFCSLRYEPIYSP